MKKRTAAGTLRQLQEIWSSSNSKERDAKKSKFGLNGVTSAFLLIPNLYEDYPDCFVPG